MAHLFLGQMVTVVRAAGRRHIVQRLFEASNVVLDKSDTKRNVLVCGSSVLDDEALRDGRLARAHNHTRAGGGSGRDEEKKRRKEYRSNGDHLGFWVEVWRGDDRGDDGQISSPLYKCFEDTFRRPCSMSLGNAWSILIMYM